MSNTKTNNLKLSLQNSSVLLLSILLLILGMFTTLTSTTSKAQNNSNDGGISSMAPGTPTNGVQLPISGTGTAGNTISIKFPDGTIATTIVKSDGTYVISPLTTQAAGNVTVIEYTPSGVIAVAAITTPYAGGVTKPATSATPKLSIKDPYLCPGKISGSVDNVNASVKIEVSKAGTVVLTLPAVVKADGTWAVDIANKLADGAYTNKFTATYNGMIATGTYDFVHKNACPTAATSASTIRTGGVNMIASIVSLVAMIAGMYFVLIKKFNS